MKYLKIFYYRVRPDMVERHLAIQSRAKKLYLRYLSSPPIHLRSGTDQNQWVELHWYESQQHSQQVAAQLANDQDQAQLWQQFQSTLDLQQFTPQIHEYYVNEIPEPLNLAPTPPATVGLPIGANVPHQESVPVVDAKDETSSAVIALSGHSSTPQESPTEEAPATPESRSDSQAAQNQIADEAEERTKVDSTVVDSEVENHLNEELPSDEECSIADSIGEDSDTAEAIDKANESDKEDELIVSESEANDRKANESEDEESFQLSTTANQIQENDGQDTEEEDTEEEDTEEEDTEEEDTEEEIELTLDDLDEEENQSEIEVEEKIVLEDEPESKPEEEPSSQHEGNGQSQAESETVTDLSEATESIEAKGAFKDSDFQFAEKEVSDGGDNKELASMDEPEPSSLRVDNPLNTFDEDDFQLPPSFTSDADKKESD